MQKHLMLLPADEVERRLYGAPLCDLNRPKLPLSKGAIEARNYLEQVRLAIKAPQEKAMPDMKTALVKALTKAEEARQQTEKQQEKTMTTATENTVTTNTVTEKRTAPNASHATFYFIRDNPGLTVDQVSVALVERGFKAGSVSSLCYQMIKVRLVVADPNGKLTAVVREYEPIKAGQRRKRSVPVKAKPTTVTRRTHTETSPAPALAAIPVTATEDWTVDAVIGRLNVRQAMAVYDELRKIFGG